MKKKPPEQALPDAGRPVVEFASVRRRLVSLVYEAFLVMAVLALFFFIPHIVLGVMTGAAFAPWVLLLHLFLVTGLYFVWYWHRHGATLAMQTWRLRVVDARDGTLLTLPRAALRYALSWPSLFCLGVGYVWAFADPDRQFMHDRLVGSCVVVLPKPERA